MFALTQYASAQNETAADTAISENRQEVTGAEETIGNTADLVAMGDSAYAADNFQLAEQCYTEAIREMVTS